MQAVLSLYKNFPTSHYKQILALLQEIQDAIVSVHGMHRLLFEFGQVPGSSV